MMLNPIQIILQVPDDLPFLPLVTITKPPLYPRLFRIVEVCTNNCKNFKILFFKYNLFFIRLVIPN